MKRAFEAVNSLFGATLTSLWLFVLLGMMLGSTPAQAQVRAYVTASADGAVSVTDVATRTFVADVKVGRAPVAVAVTPDGTRAYVANAGSNSVTVINTATNTVLTSVSVGAGPAGVAITPNGTRAYVTNAAGRSVSVIDTSTNKVLKTIPVGNTPKGVAITRAIREDIKVP